MNLFDAIFEDIKTGNQVGQNNSQPMVPYDNTINQDYSSLIRNPLNGNNVDYKPIGGNQKQFTYNPTGNDSPQKDKSIADAIPAVTPELAAAKAVVGFVDDKLAKLNRFINPTTYLKPLAELSGIVEQENLNRSNNRRIRRGKEYEAILPYNSYGHQSSMLAEYGASVSEQPSEELEYYDTSVDDEFDRIKNDNNFLLNLINSQNRK